MTEVRMSEDDPVAVARELAAFRRSALLFSSDRPRMIDQYESRWVAVLDGEVRADAEDFEALLSLIDSRGISRQRVLVRHIQRDQRTLIL